MTEQKSTSQELVRAAGRGLVHLGAIVVGFIMMIMGVAMGVTVVMLPAGIAVGIAGLFVFLWRILGRANVRGERDSTQQSHSTAQSAPNVD